MEKLWKNHTGKMLTLGVKIGNFSEFGVILEEGKEIEYHYLFNI